MIPLRRLLLRAPDALYQRLRHRQLVSFRMLSSLLLLRRTGTLADIHCVIDVGANVGQFAFMAHKVWRGAVIYSYEADAETFARLRETIAKHNLPVEASNTAIAHSAGIRMLHRFQDSSQNSLLSSVAERATHSAVQVQCRSLDDELSVVQLPERTLLKIDVQGSELDVLHGATRTLQRVRFVLVEVAFRPTYEGSANPDEVVGLLERSGFRFAAMANGLADGNGGLFEADLLFERRVTTVGSA